MIKKDNNYAFIDSQNLNLSICSLGWKIDYKKFRMFLLYLNDLKEKLEYKKEKTPEGRNLKG